ncbi:aspartate/glutamate racemase family protein [Nocardioides sp. WS12]|uniref:aspartate/glutamate racemase family protein n=1 Tax=Nocardioides sp. WS12 TaxID=2486272 RepID=UPI0015F8D17D|nr:aspartate/glutamate racemase family protein [Nocardioides sp. WS12]
MHLRVILPTIGTALLDHIRGEVEEWAAPGTTVDVIELERGTASIESEYDEALAAPGILQRIEQAAADEVDAVFITCFGDPGVHAAREIIDAPVVGGFEPAMLTAMSLGERIGIITVLPNVLPMLHSLARRYSIDRRIGCIRVVDLPVLGLEDREVLLTRLLIQATEAVTAGEADVIVLGCTGMLGVATELRDRLAAKGLAVPVIDPTGAAVTWLESAVRLGVRPSRTTYMSPPAKERTA